MSIDFEMVDDCTALSTEGYICFGRAGTLRLHAPPGLVLFLGAPDLGRRSTIAWAPGTPPTTGTRIVDEIFQADSPKGCTVLIPFQDQQGKELDGLAQMTILNRMWRHPDATGEIHFVD